MNIHPFYESHRAAMEAAMRHRVDLVFENTKRCCASAHSYRMSMGSGSR